jgi:hypothetical protein
MYIENKGGYYDADGAQHARMARFLVLMQNRGNPKEPIRAIVRSVALHQLGSWMVGTVRIGKCKYFLSGSYGNDGLPVSVLPDAYYLGTVVPEALMSAWNTGGGWNGAGAEGPAMRAWARETFGDGRKK